MWTKLIGMATSKLGIANIVGYGLSFFAIWWFVTSYMDTREELGAKKSQYDQLVVSYAVVANQLAAERILVEKISSIKNNLNIEYTEIKKQIRETKDEEGNVDISIVSDLLCKKGLASAAACRTETTTIPVDFDSTGTN